MARKKSASSAQGKQAAGKGRPMRQKIDFSDLPELSSRQLKSMKRVGRPPIGKANRQLIALRIDPEVLFKLRKIAEKSGKGYQTLINEILKAYVEKKSA